MRLGWSWLVAVLACGSSSTPTEPPKEGPGAFAADFATSPAYFSQMKGRRKGLASSPHNLVQIFYSANLRPLVTTSKFVAPKGSVAIKVQDRDGDGKPDNVMVMIKQAAGYDTAHRDWLFEQRSADGTVEDSGKIEFCGACHAGFDSSDGLPGVALRDP